MNTSNRIVYSLWILAVIAVAWGFFADFPPASAHDAGTYVADSNALDGVLESDSSKDEGSAHDSENLHCYGAGSSCHGLAALFLGHGRLASYTGAPLPRQFEAWQSGRAIVPLHRPPISDIRAIS